MSVYRVVVGDYLYLLESQPMKDDIPIEQDDKKTLSGLLQPPKGSIHVIIFVNSIVVFTIEKFSIKNVQIHLSCSQPIISHYGK